MIYCASLILDLIYEVHLESNETECVKLKTILEIMKLVAKNSPK